MKSYGGLKFVLVVLIIAVISLLAYFGSETLGVPGISKMRTGIDIRGGVYAQLYPDLPEGQKATDEQLSSARIIIEKRLDSLNIYDRNITTETEHGRIIVEIPWRADEKDYNPQTTIDEIGKTALLTFREVDADKVDENGFSQWQEKHNGNHRHILQVVPDERIAEDFDAIIGQGRARF